MIYRSFGEQRIVQSIHTHQHIKCTNQRGAANLVLTLTNDSYRKNIEKHPIEGRLDIIKIEELDTATLESAIQLHKKGLKTITS